MSKLKIDASKTMTIKWLHEYYVAYKMCLFIVYVFKMRNNLCDFH